MENKRTFEANNKRIGKNSQKNSFLCNSSQIFQNF